MDKELRPEDCRREVIGPTLHGGVRTMLFFFNENDKPCLENDSKKLLAIEYDADGNEFFSIHGFRR